MLDDIHNDANARMDQAINHTQIELNKIRKAWDEVAYEISNENPLFKKTYSSLQNFRKKYALWSDNAF